MPDLIEPENGTPRFYVRSCRESHDYPFSAEIHDRQVYPAPSVDPVACYHEDAAFICAALNAADAREKARKSAACKT